MARKKKQVLTRFKITCEDGRVYRVYATDILQATQKFKDGRPRVDPKGLAIDPIMANIEIDTEEWKTHLQDGRTVFG